MNEQNEHFVDMLQILDVVAMVTMFVFGCFYAK